MKRKFTLLLTMLLMLGAGSSWAEAVKVYSSSFGSSTCYSEGVYTSAQNYSNLMSIMEFTAGDLSSYSEFTIVVSNFTKADGTSGGAARIRFASGSDTEVKQITIYSGGTKTFKLHEKGTDENGVYYLGDVDLSSVNKVMFGGGGSGDNVGCKATFGTSNVYLTHKTLTRDDASSPINITSADDWGALKALVEGSFTSTQYSDMNAKLTDSFSVTSTIGTSAKPYSGTFNGNGNTLSFSYSGTGSYIAPFAYVENATIQNLNTTGSIESSGNLLAGVVGNVNGTTSVNNCASSMSIKSTDSSNGRIGGIVARCADSGASLTVSNCLFNGSLNSATSGYANGIVGWANGTTVNLSSCFANPTSVTNGGERFSPVKTTQTNLWFTGSSFTSNTGGTEATEAKLLSGQVAYDLQNSQATQYWGQGNLNKSNIEAYPTLTSDATKKVVKITPQGTSTPLYANPGGAAPNPVRYGALGFRLSGSETNPSLAVLPSDITDATTLVRRYDQYTLAVSAAGATTLVLPFDADLPSGVTAYDISYTSGEDKVTATPVEYNKILADKPVLINADEGTYTFTVSNSSEITWSGATVSNGALTGVYVQNGKSGDYNPFAYVPADSYVLQKQGENLGFYKVNADNTIKITSFRAYLTPQAAGDSVSPAPMLRIIFGNTTGITDLKKPTVEDDVIYNLNGMRVTNPSKGLYIVNGKKVVIK